MSSHYLLDDPRIVTQMLLFSTDSISFGKDDGYIAFEPIMSPRKKQVLWYY